MRALKLYVATHQNGATKIGVSKNPQKRMLSLDSRPTLVHVEPVPPELGAYDVERLAHAMVDENTNGLGTEWFNITAERAVEAVKRALEIAETKGCLINWHINIKISPKAKRALQRMADDDEIQVDDLIGGILQDYVTVGSTA